MRGLCAELGRRLPELDRARAAPELIERVLDAARDVFEYLG